MGSSQDVPGLTGHVAHFVAGTGADDVPPEVLHLGKKSILDGLAAAIVGAGSETCEILRDYLGSVASAAPAPGASLIGGGAPLPPPFAALVNGTAMHADDYDDTMQAMTGKFQGIHPTAPVFCALLADGEVDRRSGAEVLISYHVGVEVACKLFDATAPDHILSGFHATGTCGMLGAAAAVAHLRGLSSREIRTALGIAASQAGGLQENFGTMTKPFHAGRAAQTGIMAVELAGRGFTASPIILEAPRGFFQAQGGGWEPQHIVDRLGSPWSFVDRGIWLKPWPTGSLGHPALTLMTELVETHDIAPDDVDSILLSTSENIHKTLLHHRPGSELEAKFSLEFCLAAILVERKLGLGQFNDEFVLRPDIQEAIERIDYRTFSEETARTEGYSIVTSLIEIRLKSGRRVSGKLDYGKGSKANPMTDQEVEEKLRDCSNTAGWTQARADAVIETVWSLEDAPDIAGLAALLSGAT